MDESIVRDGVPCRLVRLVEEQEKRPGSFVCVTWESLDLLHAAFPNLDRLVAVFACVLNACRTSGTRTITLRPRWYSHLQIHVRTVERCLNRLEGAGLLTQVKHRGKSPEIRLADHVPLDLSRQHARR